MGWKDMFPKENRYFETDNGILYCGDCLEIMKKFPKESVHLVFTSPPYFVGKEYEDRDKTPEGYKRYLNFLLEVFGAVQGILIKGGNLYINIDDAHTSLNSVFKKSIVLPTHAHLIVNLSEIFDYKEMILWRKVRGKNASGGAKRLLGSYGRFGSPGCIPVVQECEYILWFRKAGSRKDITDELRKKSALTPYEFKKYGMQIWEIKPERASKIGHPAPFPVELASRIIKIGSFVGDIVLDMFFGSGTTGAAAEILGRRWIGIELNPEYCEIAKKRIEKVLMQPYLL
jgi:site-specific DNA-methyltransferase (adenine-specific)